MLPADFAGWNEFLKGLGTAGLFILFLMVENARLRKDRAIALANERAANAVIIDIIKAQNQQLLSIKDKDLADAIANREVQSKVAQAIGDLASNIEDLTDRVAPPPIIALQAPSEAKATP